MSSYRLYSRLTAVLLLALLPLGLAHAEPRIDERFRDYYRQHQGLRVLGNPLSNLTEIGGYPAQYFEKGRIEDHRGEATADNWAFMYGRLTMELIEQASADHANSTNLTYRDIGDYADATYRHSAPSGFRGGTLPVNDGTFVPFDAQLRPAPGYVVAPYFWAYMNRADLFPGGWLHDIGLPITDPLTAKTTKAGEDRPIFMQAFERTILTYDMRNPAGWQVERGNIGADALRAQPAAAAGPIEIPPDNAEVTLPIHILAHVGVPGTQVMASLRWQDGATISRAIPVLKDTDGSGLVIGNLSWSNEVWQMPPSQAASLDLRGPGDQLLARRTVRVLSYDDADVQEINVYWVLGDNVWPALQHVPKTPRVGTASLEALLWGPPPPNLAGFTSAIPSSEQVLGYPYRELDWGSRVTLRSLTIQNGVATADFSAELRAYEGDERAEELAQAQIAHTLMQFASVRQVRITIQGFTEAVVGP